MIAIKSYPNHHQYVVCDGVMREYASFLPDGTFTGNAGISVHAVSRRFESLEEAEEAKKAYEEYAAKYKQPKSH